MYNALVFLSPHARYVYVFTCFLHDSLWLCEIQEGRLSVSVPGAAPVTPSLHVVECMFVWYTAGGAPLVVFMRDVHV